MFCFIYLCNMCFYCVLSSNIARFQIVEKRLHCGMLASIPPSGSVTGYYERVKNCFLDDFLICTWKQTNQTVDDINSAFENAGICGVLVSQFVKSSFPLTFYLKVPTKYKLSVIIFIFQFPWINTHCPAYAMTIKGMVKQDHTERTYCGKRMPWNEVYDNSCVLKIKGTTVAKIYFDLFFSLIQKRNLISYYSHLSYKTSAILNLYSFVSNVSNNIRVVLRLSTKPFMFIQLKFTDKNDWKAFDVRDGPGVLSRKIKTDDVNDIRFSSAYVVSIYFMDTTLNHTDYTLGYESLAVIDYKERKLIPCKHVGGMRSLKEYGESSEKLRFDSSLFLSNMACHIFYSSYSDLKAFNYPILHIRQYNFVGNTIFNESLPIACQYGGLFAYSLTRSGKIEEIKQYCNSSEDQLPPFIMSEKQSLLVVMVWYSSYSRGTFEGFIDMMPCTYRTIDVTKSQQIGKPYIINYNTSCDFIFLDSSVSDMNGYNEKNHTVNIISETNLLGPVILDFFFRNRTNISECLHHFTLNMTFYEKWMPYVKHRSIHLKANKIPALSFNLLKHINITISTCILSKGRFVIVIEKPFCFSEEGKGRTAELSDNSMILTKTCTADMHVRLYDRSVLKFVTLPEKNHHKKKIRIRYDRSCITECMRHSFSLLEYIPHVDTQCEYIVDLDGHTIMELVAVHAREGFLITVLDHVKTKDKDLCENSDCYPRLTTTTKRNQSLTSARYKLNEVYLFSKRYVIFSLYIQNKPKRHKRLIIMTYL